MPFLRPRIEGLGFPDLPGCNIDAQAYATGSMVGALALALNRSSSAATMHGARGAGLRLNLGVDACAEQGSSTPH